MDDLEYSLDAKNILDQFYEVDVILYVEGIDDKIFWSILFEKFYGKSIEIIEQNGIENLTKYIDDISSNKITNAFVACDQDYHFFNDKEWHNKIVCTYGHSIENSLVNVESMIDIVKSFSKYYKKDIIRNVIENWVIDFHEKIENLIYCDIYNEQHKLGLSVSENNCDRYFINKNSYKISESNVKSKLDSIFDSEEITEIKNQLKNHNEIIFPNFIRGHFLSSAATRFTTLLSSELSNKKISIAKDAFFSCLTISFEKNLDTHQHMEYYKNKIEALLN